MEQTVYLDVLLVVNFVVDYLLLLAVAKLARHPPRRRRLLLGAFAGSLSSLILFAPPLSFLLSAGYKLGTAVVMAAVSFPWQGKRSLARDTFFLFTVSYLYAGVMLAVWQSVPQVMLCYNGVVYLNVSTMVLLVTTALAYGALWLFDQFFRRSRAVQGRRRVTVTLDGRAKTVMALLDSGNTLREPFTGDPVAVCSLGALEELLPDGYAQAVRQGDLARCGELAARWQPRIIPYHSVGGEGTLPAFRPTKLEVEWQEDVFQVEGIYLAVSPALVGGEDYQMLLSPEMVRLSI